MSFDLASVFDGDAMGDGTGAGPKPRRKKKKASFDLSSVYDTPTAPSDSSFDLGSVFEEKSAPTITPDHSAVVQPFRAGAGRSFGGESAPDRKTSAPADALAERTIHPREEPTSNLGKLGRAAGDMVVGAMNNPPAAMMQTLGFMTPPGAAIGIGLAAKDAGGYLGQRAAELSLPDDVRRMAEKDPTRLRGEDTALNALMMAAPAAIHGGVRALRGRGARLAEPAVQPGAELSQLAQPEPVATDRIARPVEMADRDAAIKDWAQESVQRPAPESLDLASIFEARDEAPPTEVAKVAQDPTTTTIENGPNAAAPGTPGTVGRRARSGAGGLGGQTPAGPRDAGIAASPGAPPDASAVGVTDQAAAAVAPVDPVAPLTVGVRDKYGRLRRNLRDVPTADLADEIMRLGDSIGEDRAGPVVIPDDNYHTFNDGRAWVGNKRAGINAAGRNIARNKAMTRITAEIGRRGEIVEDVIDAAFERSMERRDIQAEGEEADASFGFGERTAPERTDLFGNAVAPTVEQASLFTPDVGAAKAKTPGAISPEEMAARRDELGAPEQPRGDTRGNMDLFANPVGPAVQAGAKGVLGAARWTRDLPPVAKIRDAWQRAFDPAARSAEAGQTAVIARTRLGEQAGDYEVAAHALEQGRRAFDHASDPERLQFIHHMETGARQATPELTAFAGEIRKTLDTMRDKIRGLGTGALDSFIEDYFPHIWEDPAKAQQVFAQAYGVRPLEGSKAFLKERTIPTIADGIAKGLKPVTTNPVDLTLLKLREMQRYHMAQQVVGDMKAQGLLQLVPHTARAPAGWIRLNDKIARVYGVGDYYAPEPAAKIINNYLSPGLRGNAIYDAVRGAGNAINQAQLGLSAFHVGFTTFDAFVSRLALGLEQASHGKPLTGLSTIASAPAAPITNALLGHQIKRAYLEPGKHGAFLDQMASYVRRAGGRVKMDSFYKNSAPEKLVDAIRQGRVASGAREYGGVAKQAGRAVLNTPGAILQTVTKPIMEHVVPAQKLGVFGDLAQEAIERLHRTNPNATVAQEDAVLARVWNSVDNRMGQLVYDNLFWNKTFKDLAMASTRSVGWNLGTIRELGGGMGDIAREGLKLTAGEHAELTHRAAYIIALPIAVGMIGAVINYLTTGEAPQNLKDYYFPRTGTMDADGNEDRVQLPSYMKDVTAYTGDPWQTVKHKMAPQLAMMGEMFNNQDFYGDMIRNPDDPYVKQAMQEAKYVIHAVAPFSFTNMQETAKRGDTSALGRYGPWVGITPAPRRMVRSDAQNQMASYLAQRRTSGATPEDAEARRARRDILGSLRGQNLDKLDEEVSNAMERGQLTPPQFSKLLKRAGTVPMVEQFKRLTVPQAIDVFGQADERERGLFMEALNKKIANASRRGAMP